MRDWASALIIKPPKDTSGICGRLRLAWFRHRRRTLEANLFAGGPVTLWHVVKQQNTEWGVWR